VRTVSFHPLLTSLADIDGIVGNRGFCKATKGIRENELVDLHEVKVDLLVIVFRLDCI
jgi:hypothetical protein